MRTCVWLAAVVFLLAAPALADDKPNLEQLKKAYDDTLIQLKAAQDTKNDLARQNDKLSKQLDDVQKQLAAARSQIGDLQREVSDNDQKTFNLRSYRAAWQGFLRAHPDLMVRWKLFLGEDALAVPQEALPLIDINPLAQDP